MQLVVGMPHQLVHRLAISRVHGDPGPERQRWLLHVWACTALCQAVQQHHGTAARGPGQQERKLIIHTIRATSMIIDNVGAMELIDDTPSDGTGHDRRRNGSWNLCVWDRVAVWGPQCFAGQLPTGWTGL